MQFDFIAAESPATTLVVILHGLAGSPAGMKDVVAVARNSDPLADILIPHLSYGGPFGLLSFVRVEDIVRDVLVEIDHRFAQATDAAGAPRYQRIRLAGHSFGAVLARKIVIVAHGELPEAPFEAALQPFAAGRPWANRITRLVLLAGMSRGWSADTARSWWLAFSWKCASLFGELLTLPMRRPPTLFAIRQGAPFIIQTRLQWLALVQSDLLLRRNREQESRLTLVQLLGTVDDYVSPADVVDHAIDLHAHAAGRFCFIEMPGTGHANAIAMQLASTGSQLCLPSTAATVRAAVKVGMERATHDEELLATIRGCIFSLAIAGDKAELDAVAVPFEHLAQGAPPSLDVKDVVFVIHGIRDRGFWTQKIARALMQEWDRQASELPAVAMQEVGGQEVAGQQAGQRDGGAPKTWHVLTPSYGYFAMAPFVLPWVRRWKAAWLMDCYTEAKARFPNAEFSFVGHSNGTYLAARALQDYPAVTFKRIVFAGSVVRKGYDWASLMNTVPPRVGSVLNYIATKDAVVAIFPKGLQPLRFFFDLGSAGHDGFSRWSEALPANLHQVSYVMGGHGAGIKEAQWDDIARFIVHGTVPAPEEGKRSRWVVAIGWISTLLLLAFLTVVIAPGLHLLLAIICADGAAGLWRAGAFAGYCLFVYLVLSRV